MMLKKYRVARDLSAADFAKLIGVANDSVVGRYERGDRMPRPEIVERIRKVTKGMVTFDDHLAACRKRRAARAVPKAEPSETDAVPA